MKTIYYTGTKHTPKLAFNKTGSLRIEGDSIGDNLTFLYYPALSWCKKFDKPEVIFDLMLTNINKESMLWIVKIIDALEENERVKNVEIRWHRMSEENEFLEKTYSARCQKSNFRIINKKEYSLIY